MYNDLLSIGPVTLHTYGLMIGLALIAAVTVMELRAEKRQIGRDQIYPLAVTCIAGGLAGAKILYLLTVLPQLLDGTMRLAEAVTGGWVVLGGILGGMLAGYLFCRRRGLPVAATFDLAMPSIALAQGIGRIGCFFAGCCYGVPWEGPMALVFTNSHFAPNHVSLFPSQVISSLGDFLICGILLLLERRQGRPWTLTGWYLVLYSLGRIGIEFFRGDLERGAVGPLSTSQFICLFMLAAGILLLARSSRRKQEEAPA